MCSFKKKERNKKRKKYSLHKLRYLNYKFHLEMFQRRMAEGLWWEAAGV